MDEYRGKQLPLRSRAQVVLSHIAVSECSWEADVLIDSLLDTVMEMLQGCGVVGRRSDNYNLLQAIGSRRELRLRTQSYDQSRHIQLIL